MNINLQNLLEYSKKLNRKGSLKRHQHFNKLVEATRFLPTDCSVVRRLWHIEHRSAIPKCKVCDNNAAWDNHKGGFYRTYCSNKCAISDPDRLSKIQSTNKRRYGHNSPFGSRDVQAKSKATIQQKYGVDNVSHIPKVNDKRRETLILSRNKNIGEIDRIQNMINDGYTQKGIGRELDITQPRVSNLLNRLNLKTNKTSLSTEHQDILNFIKSTTAHHIDINVNGIIPTYELDICIPELNLAIEVDGIFWHSELSGRGRKYHINKTSECIKQGIKLIHIFSNEWHTKNGIVKSRLKYVLGSCDRRLYARNCQVEVIDHGTSRQFVHANHIQGPRNAAYNYGLYHGEELVMVATLSNHSNYEFELIRSCSLRGVSVVGGLGKIIKKFISDYQPSTILSYADRRWGDGQSYGKIGFQCIGNTQPNYWYFRRNGDTNTVFSRLTFQKHKLANILNDFDPTLTEWQNMVKNGYDRIWDCGNSKWVWTNSKL